MTDARRSHEQKTLQDRRSYFQRTILPKESPTVDLKSIPEDSTDAIQVEPEELTAAAFRSTNRTASWLGQFFRQKGIDVFLSVVATVLLGIGSWLAIQVFAMNRELGELRVRYERTTQEAEKRQQDASRELEKTEERLQKALDRLESRLVPPPASHPPAP
ncbi:MAG: hypothetical protein L6R30_24825 [Thermoanaerobaculia bacterium]|nr:hypothetical protein [Thermoanaerobaculia bacterium]